jgi:apolipoprotein N-acyltransferase
LQENSDPYLFWSGIALDIFHPIFFFFPFLLFFISNRLVGNSLSMWLFPMFWTIFEWLHSIGDMGYSWLSIAHTQYTNLYWYQIIDIAGIWGATFLLVTANVLIYKLMLSGKNENGKQKTCTQCVHDWDKHKIMGYGEPPREGWMVCPEKDCFCFNTWDLDIKVSSEDFLKEEWAEKE